MSDAGAEGKRKWSVGKREQSKEFSGNYFWRVEIRGTKKPMRILFQMSWCFPYFASRHYVIPYPFPLAVGVVAWWLPPNRLSAYLLVWLLGCGIIVFVYVPLLSLCGGSSPMLLLSVRSFWACLVWPPLPRPQGRVFLSVPASACVWLSCLLSLSANWRPFLAGLCLASRVVLVCLSGI